MKSLFDLTDRVIVVTGATGALAGSAANYLAAQNARVVYLGRSQEKLDAALSGCRAQTPDAECLGIIADVLDRPALERVRDQVLQKWRRIDGLLNGAGGNMPGATVPPEKSFSDLDFDSFQQVIDLNLHGTVLPSLVLAPLMVEGGSGSIINFSSVSAPQAVTRVVGYSAAKSAVESFTRWLAVDMARRTGGKVRVNALLPGFFIGEQNRRLLTNQDGSLTERGQLVIQNTPFGRFGEADELHGAVHYLLSNASKFATGTTMPVDGGFVAYSGV
ncbi:NAD(P)-dependent dehydrogenase (short-subunit alcohol dehydrogenase family) [Rhodopirellula rubra]|uniref:NAD(P)-dependent dehydrogenase (Short-subunit alcohol dehydrogenase family) n=1 Tax=Aporhodopirellula rubra TaxID=980271 RepID=A0A7W5DXR9_9BACT|nr:SDR family oxidoreductase [Aporhodopirellula rubra]MBB3206179.1 NAD(P)-dependent dehydrogenase (short-subunit alcohol dehydrogenase family) [Aporhodopirellula rubra]